MGACASKKKSVVAFKNRRLAPAHRPWVAAPRPRAPKHQHCPKAPVHEICLGLEAFRGSEPEATFNSVSASTSRMTVEERIELSRLHWSTLARATEPLSVEEAATIKLDNEEVFKTWTSHPEWGFFFKARDEFQELNVGEKFAEGAQAEIFHVRIRWWDLKENEMDREKGITWVLKVFKEGTLLRDLQLQWPNGLFRYYVAARKRHQLGKPPWIRYHCDVQFAILLEDGRFAFLMQKEDQDLRSRIDHKMLKSGRRGVGPFRNNRAHQYMFDVALGMDQLHRFNIVHRDLKASNVLLYSTGTSTYCYVADFECSMGVLGTGYWRAPEIIRACKEGNVKEKPELFSKAADIYSLGMTFYEILTGKHPFQGEDVTMDLVIGGRQPRVPRFVRKWAHELLCWCWELNCDARPSIDDILRILEANLSSPYITACLAERFKARCSYRLEDVATD